MPLLNDIMYQFGVVVVQFDSAPIRVSGYMERDRVFDSRTLLNRLSSHYSGLSLKVLCCDVMWCHDLCSNKVVDSVTVLCDLSCTEKHFV